MPSQGNIWIEAREHGSHDRCFQFFVGGITVLSDQSWGAVVGWCRSISCWGLRSTELLWGGHVPQGRRRTLACTRWAGWRWWYLCKRQCIGLLHRHHHWSRIRFEAEQLDTNSRRSFRSILEHRFLRRRSRKQRHASHDHAAIDQGYSRRETRSSQPKLFKSSDSIVQRRRQSHSSRKPPQNERERRLKRAIFCARTR